MLKAAYGETMIHSTETVWEILAREEWLGCQHDISPMVDIPGSTPVRAQYMLFFYFNKYKSIYVICFKKTYMYYERNTSDL